MSKRHRNLSLALNLTMLVAGMAMLAYASVPLYRLFCQVTGFGGTTTQAKALPETISDRKITVYFNADHAPGLPWQFSPGERSVTATVGAEVLTHYTAENLSEKPVTGRAIYNVVPHKAGEYFAKIECFCFTEQTLKPGERVNMPVAFFLDPELLNDPEMDDVQEITLSYTFFPATS